MIKINNITEKSSLSAISQQYSINISDSDRIAGIFDGDNVIGFAQYSLSEQAFDILYISDLNNDFYLMDALMKTLFYYADINKKRYFIMPLEYESYSKLLPFSKNDNSFIIDLLNMDITNKCICGKD